MNEYNDYVFLMGDGERIASQPHRNLTKSLNLNEAGKVLDVGCGGGDLLLSIRKKYPNIDLYGLDLSSDNVNYCKKKSLNVFHKSYQDFFVESSIKFDVIFFVDVIEHIDKKDLIELFDLAFKNLTDSGVLVLQSPNPESFNSLKILYSDLTHSHMYSSSLIQKIGHITGFKSVEFLDTGPVPKSVTGIVRFVLWRILSYGISFFNLIECGNKGSGVYTRNVITVLKK